MSCYYDPDGKPMTLEEWAHVFEARGKTGDDSWWRRSTETPKGTVSTVWLGLDHRMSEDGPPLFWESMVFGDDAEIEQDMQRYSSREEAWKGHDALVASLTDA